MADEENQNQQVVGDDDVQLDDLKDSIISQGGQINSMPTQGYCLVFNAETDWYTMKFDQGLLKVERNPDMDENTWNEEGYEEKLNDAVGRRRVNNVLLGFKKANIQYKIIRSKDKLRKYFYVIITAKKSVVEEWADRHNTDLAIEPIEAVRVGRMEDDFVLARRTHIEADDKSDTFRVDEHGDEVTAEVDSSNTSKHVREFPKLPLSAWENIHVSYEDSIPKTVYKHDEDGNMLDNRTYLRLLYEMLTDDRKLGGANFLVEKYLATKAHPLQFFFALHEYPLQKRPTLEGGLGGWLKCRTPSQNLELVHEIRDYYGENVGFYFAFLVHYTKWLFPMAVIGTIWEIVQLAVKSKWGLGTPGSLVIIIIAIMWSVFLVENWYRREWKLRFNWGMMRYSETEVPRPTFKGKITVSRETGEIIEDYASWVGYILKRFCSYSSLLFCLAIAVSAVIGLIILKKLVLTDSLGTTVWTGIVNAVWIQISNRLYTIMAIKLNEWEGHRLQQDYYNNLVTKRILFIVFNSFYSLFVIAFGWGWLDNYDSPTDPQRLDDLLTQLLTLFFSAIVINNSLELVFPLLFKYIKEYCAKKQEEDWEENNGSSLLSDDQIGDRAQVNVVDAADAGDENVDNDRGIKASRPTRSNIHINKSVMEDIEDQCMLGPSPDVLSNTAEIVVLHGYIILFVIIFPIMPLLAVVNNYIEFRLDAYNLFEAQRPVPMSASGIGVWRTVMSTFNMVAIASNLALFCFRTDRMSDLLVFLGIEASDRNLVISFFSIALFLILVIVVIRTCVPDKSHSVKEAIARQEACEKHLFMAPLQNKAKAAHKEQQRKSILDAIAKGQQGDDDQKHEQ